MAEYRIKSVARLTGLSPDTIRKWERRYGAVTPVRDARGVRRYSEADLKRLRDLNAALEVGYPIGEAAALEQAALEKLIAQKLPQVRRLPPKATKPDAFARAVLRGLERYDGEQIDRMLTAASHLFSPAEFVFDVMSPLFQKIGEEWRAGTMQVAQEHLFSAVARSVLGGLIRRFATSREAPLALFTTPAGEPHEFGILLAAMLAASEGMRVHYLGPNMPPDTIARASADVRATTVVLGASRTRARAGLAREIDSLAAALPPQTALWLGGRAAEHSVAKRHAGAVTAVPTLQEFYERIRALRGEGGIAVR